MNSGSYRDTRRDFSRRSAFETDQKPPLTYTVNELPHPHVLLTFGLLNLKPAPSSVSM